MSAYNRAHQLNIDNQSPPEDDFCDETWAEACEHVARDEADAYLVDLLADDYTTSALYIAINGCPLSSRYKLQLSSLLNAAAEAQASVRNRYDALMASRGAP